MNSLKASAQRLLMVPFYGLRALAVAYGSLLNKVRPGLGQIGLDQQNEKNSETTLTVTHISKGKKHEFTFFTPNALCHYRAESLSQKEPETLQWIDDFGGHGVLFDIGANVGLYSVYYAATTGDEAFAFEPSFFNLPLLAKNIHVNRLHDKVHIIANPLSDQNDFADFALSSTVEGGALSAFGVDYGYDGKPLTKTISYQTLGFSLDALFAKGILKTHPKLVKIDVDGIEHLILSGAHQTLSHPTCRSVLIEVSPAFKKQAEEVTRILTSCGFILDPQYNLHTTRTSGLEATSNQIWIKV